MTDVQKKVKCAKCGQIQDHNPMCDQCESCFMAGFLTEAQKCVWKINKVFCDDYYETSCGASFRFPPKRRSNVFKYCPYCGKEIEEVE